MKRIYLLTLMSLAAASASFGQYTPSPQQDTTIDEPSRVTWGLHAGVNVANMSYKVNGTSFGSASYLGGATGGLDLQLPVTSSFIIQPELNFSQIGGIFNKNEGEDLETKLKETYLTVPVLLKYKFSGFGIYVGPQYGLLLSSSKSTSGVNTLKDAFRENDFAGILGVEYFLACNLGFSLRYQLGFANVAKADANATGTVLKNNAFSFTVGYRF